MERPLHTADEQCLLDAADTCLHCGAYHGDPCPFCHGSAFHRSGCLVMEPDADYGPNDPKLLCQTLVRTTEEEQTDMDHLRLIPGAKRGPNGEPLTMSRSEFLRDALRFRINFVRMVRTGYFHLRTAFPFGGEEVRIRENGDRIHGSGGKP